MTNQQIAIRGDSGLTKEGLDHTRDQLTLLENFVKDVLRKDEDYGVIPGTSGKSTLLKPGAINIAAAFNCHAEPLIDEKTLDPDMPFVSYEVHVDLISNLSGLVMARGYGNCNSHERKYRYRWEGRGEDRHQIENSDVLDQANTIKKMAIKRAEVDAAMRLPGVARFFTQDLDDMERQDDQPAPAEFFCTDHKMAYARHENDKGEVWYSHRLPNGKFHNMPKNKAETPPARDDAPADAATSTPSPAEATPPTEAEWQKLYAWAKAKWDMTPGGVHLVLGKSAAEWTATAKAAQDLLVAAKTP